MTIQLLLTVGVLAVLFYALAHRRQTPVVAVVISAGSLVGCFFVWYPETANDVARWVGVGRGADLVFYCWGVISAGIIVNLHVKARLAQTQFTALIRELALASPMPARGDRAEHGSGGR